MNRHKRCHWESTSLAYATTAILRNNNTSLHKDFTTWHFRLTRRDITPKTRDMYGIVDLRVETNHITHITT